MPPRPVSTYKGATLVTPMLNDLPSFSGCLVMLHQIAWGRKQLSILFHDHVVKRDVDSIPQRVVKVLHWHQDRFEGLLSKYDVESILVRKEYLGTLRNLLIATRNHGESEDKDAMDVDTYSQLSGIHLDDLAKPLAGAATVIGSPGIGKSTFLIFVLALRTLAGLPTLFQIDKGGLFVICQEGVFDIRCPITSGDRLEEYIPRYTWLLFDCGQSLVTVPEELVTVSKYMRGFILQAAAPGMEQLAWRKKTRVKQSWMAPWTLEELIEGRDLQIWLAKKERPSESQLNEFCTLFGTSARGAYGYATKPSEYESLVSSQIRMLTKEKIRDLTANPEGLGIATGFSDLVFIATLDHADRRKFRFAIASNHLNDMVLERLRMIDQ